MSRARSIFIFLPVILTILISFLFQFTILSDVGKVSLWLSSFGNCFIFAYIIIQTLTIVIAPIGGAFIWLPMMAIMGPEKGLILSYLITTPAYCLNFYLAKRYGRNLIQRLMGKSALTKIDHLASDAGITTVVIFKILQGGYFDYVSYAAGLTKMSWKDFLIINFLGGIPSSFITYIIFSQFNNFVAGVLVFYIISGLLIALSIYFHHLHQKHKNKIWNLKLPGSYHLFR